MLSFGKKAEYCWLKFLKDDLEWLGKGTQGRDYQRREFPKCLSICEGNCGRSREEI